MSRLNIVNGKLWTLSIFATSPSTGLNCKLQIAGLLPEVKIKDDVDFNQLLKDLGRDMDLESLGQAASDWRLMTAQEVMEYLDEESDDDSDQ